MKWKRQIYFYMYDSKMFSLFLLKISIKYIFHEKYLYFMFCCDINYEDIMFYE